MPVRRSNWRTDAPNSRNWPNVSRWEDGRDGRGQVTDIYFLSLSFIFWHIYLLLLALFKAGKIVLGIQRSHH